jgi:acyl-coenzyme A thioesterase PaaI-like protein
MSLNFVGAAGPGPLHLRAETTGGGRRTCFCEGRIEDGKGNPIATAQGAFKLMDAGSETP